MDQEGLPKVAKKTHNFVMNTTRITKKPESQFPRDITPITQRFGSSKGPVPAEHSSLDPESVKIVGAKTQRVKSMNPQEVIDKYYEELEELEQQMKMKKQEVTLRSVGFDQPDRSTKSRARILEEEWAKEHEKMLALSKEKTRY